MDVLHAGTALRAHPSAVARATGIPKRTLQDWVQPYLEQRTNHGYPLSVWEQLLQEHEWPSEVDLVGALHGAEPRMHAPHDAAPRDDAQEMVHARAAAVQRDGMRLPEGAIAEIVGRATGPLERLLAEERSRVDQERQRASVAEQAAAMWQERARNLETENAKLQELLALPAYEEPEPRRRWWQRWRG